MISPIRSGPLAVITGRPPARLELRIAHPALLRRFGDLRATVADEQIRLREQMAVYGVRELPVAF